MRSSLLFTAAVGVAACAPAQAVAQDNAVTLLAKPPVIVFGGATVLSGQVTGPGNAGVRVDLLEDAFPLGELKPAKASTTTDAGGSYSFTVKPTLLTRYQVTAKAKPAVSSAAVDVRVRPAIALAAGDRIVRRAQRVRFTGSVTPAHDGATALLQRRIGSGRFRTVRRLTLSRSAVAGRSDFSGAVRVRRTAVYRVRLPGHADHATGTSNRVRIRVR